jgi:hypothetical protein
MGATSRNPYPSRGGGGARGRRAGDHDDRGGPRWNVDVADGRHAAPADAQPCGTRRHSRPGPDRTVCTRRRAARRCRSGPAGSCPARVPERARREFVLGARGVRDRSSIGPLPSPGRPWISPRAFILSACCMGAIPIAAARAGELPGRTCSPSTLRRGGQKSADRGGPQHSFSSVTSPRLRASSRSPSSSATCAGWGSSGRRGGLPIASAAGPC